MNRQSWTYEVQQHTFRKIKPSPNQSTNTASTTGPKLHKNLRITTLSVNAQANNAGNGGTTTSTLQSTKNLGITNRNKDFLNCIRYTETGGRISLATSLAGTNIAKQNRQRHKKSFLFDPQTVLAPPQQNSRIEKFDFTNARDQAVSALHNHELPL